MAKAINEFLGEQSEHVLQLKSQLLEKDKILENYKKEHGNLQVFFDAVRSSIDAIEPSRVIYKHKDSPDKSTCHAVAHITDGHMGAVQLADEIEGFNSFDPKICRDRQLDFAYRFCKYIDNQRIIYNIHECHVLVTGDLISGDIHQELQVTNAFPSPVQCVKAAQVLSEQLHIFSQNFDVVHVHFITEDNHSRLTKKPQASEAGINSLNYLVGHLAESYTEKLTNVNWNIYPMLQKVVSVGHRNYLITHGHGIKSWAGLPWYGIERKTSKESQNRLKRIMDLKAKMSEIGFHLFIFGHLHTEIKTDQYMCGPSVQGTTAYDHKNARYGDPGQVGWLVHPKYDETARENFKL